MDGTGEGMGWVQWVSLIALPAFLALGEMLRRHAEKDDRRSESTHQRIDGMQRELSEHKVTVANSYVTQSALDRMGAAITARLERMEGKIDAMNPYAHAIRGAPAE